MSWLRFTSGLTLRTLHKLWDILYIFFPNIYSKAWLTRQCVLASINKARSAKAEVLLPSMRPGVELFPLSLQPDYLVLNAGRLSGILIRTTEHSLIINIEIFTKTSFCKRSYLSANFMSRRFPLASQIRLRSACGRPLRGRSVWPSTTVEW